MFDHLKSNILYLSYGGVVVYLFIKILEKVERTAQASSDRGLGETPVLRSLKKFGGTFSHFLVSHRGGHVFGPPNTLCAFRQSVVETNCSFIEIDLSATKDNEIVCIHDSKLELVTQEVGYVENITCAELQTFDAGYRFEVKSGNDIQHPFRGKGYKIPTLDEVFSETKDAPTKNGRPVLYYLDFKTAKIADKAFALISRHSLDDRVVFGANDFFVNRQICRRKKPSIPMSVDMASMSFLFVLHKLNLLRYFPLKHDIYGMTVTFMGLRTMNRKLLKEFQSRGKLFAVLGAELNEEAPIEEMAKMGADFILSDVPVRLCDVVKRCK